MSDHDIYLRCRAAAQCRSRRKRKRQDSTDGCGAERSNKRTRRTREEGEIETKPKKRGRPRSASKNNGDSEMDIQRVYSHGDDPAKRAEREATIDARTGEQVCWTKFIRDTILNRGSTAVRNNPWLLETPYDIRDDVRKDLMTAMKGCWTKLRDGTIDKFKLRFRSWKKCKSETVHIRRRWITQTQNTIILKLPGQKKIELWTGQRAWHGDIVMDDKL